jgi:hypothetical protein
MRACWRTGAAECRTRCLKNNRFPNPDKGKFWLYGFNQLQRRAKTGFPNRAKATLVKNLHTSGLDK